VIAATLIALFSHVQVLPLFTKDEQLEQGAILYAEPNPSTRLSLSVVKGNNGVTAKANVRWRF
jgi:hypothetical protein